MRYAIISDIHANLEALEAVLAKIDELRQEEPIEQIWFLGDLVGYGPNPNECIIKLREHTDIIIAGNHDWAAVGKIDLEDFSEAARISAEWTAQELTEEHREFLANLPEQLEIGECTLVHGSPYGPLWEYLTSEVLAERSFQYFTTRFCLVGHTHVPVIFQQPDDVANTPTHALEHEDAQAATDLHNGVKIEVTPEDEGDFTDDDEETTRLVAVRLQQQSKQATEQNEHAVSAAPKADETSEKNATPDTEDTKINHSSRQQPTNDVPTAESHDDDEDTAATDTEAAASPLAEESEQHSSDEDGTTPEETIASAEEQLNQEIEELLSLLGLSQSMVQVTNEMIIPPEGLWQPAERHRAIINPGGVGQPRDGDPRAALMIYDTERGFTFYRVPYAIEQTQEKIIKAGLPQYLAIRLAYGR